jgi:hypothetical protein
MMLDFSQREKTWKSWLDLEWVADKLGPAKKANARPKNLKQSCFF